MENIWNPNINRLAYNYNWSFDENGNPKVNFYIDEESVGVSGYIQEESSSVSNIVFNEIEI